MKLKNLIILFCLFFFVNCYSQDVPKAKNIIYLDVGLILSGKSIDVGVGLNYERMLNDNFSIRAGANIGFFETYIIGDKIKGTCIGFPVTFNYMTKNKNKFETGLGGGPWINFDEENSLAFFPSIKLGYRYQPDENGLMFKAGLEIPSNAYISFAGVGYHFK
ncbi:MAG: hypothetical protein NTU73_12615 [Ignavibacteriae bacterium]|nr:hypothetical protein [Ignavibacteriota bacterium]